MSMKYLRPLALALGTAMCYAQQPSSVSQHPSFATPPVADAPTPIPTLSVDARLVTLPAVVRDKKGALVTNLTKDDFTLKVDGTPQALRYFDRDSHEPLTLGLLVDTSQSQRDVLDQERTASAAFLQSMLDPTRDKAFVAQFARQTELLQDLTDSRPKLQAALQEIDTQPNTPPPDNGSSNDPNGSGSNNGSNHGSGGGSDGQGSTDQNGGRGGQRRSYAGGGTVLYDALFLGSDELMKKQHGRKAIVILSDGVDNGSRESLARSIEAAQRSDTIVYAIYFKGEEHRDNSSQGNRGGFPGGGRRGGMGIPGVGFPGGGGGGGGGGGQRGGGQQGGGQRNSVDGKKILQRMCDETGGRFFEVTKKQTVADIYKQIGEELRAQYRLGYTPTAALAAEGYHQIELDLSGKVDKHDTVQTRDGYYSGGKS
jgi:VWFA-related protein